VLNLIREAVDLDIPVLGHCLGGQLMSKALGGIVSANHVKEIGWGDVLVSDNAEAQKWFGNTEQFLSFHWHGETFTLPEGSTHLLSSQYCQNQAYSIGKHLGFQCHIEMTDDMVKTWCETGQDEVQACAGCVSVQTSQEIQADLANRIANLNAQAKVIYTHWIKGLKTS
jgi:GMP synthase-like glutamine amidotransferase